MAHHGISAAARTRNAVVAFAVAASGMTAIASTAQALAPVGGDAQLVVADVSGGTSQDLSATSLLTVNINGTHSLAKPVALPTANAGSDKAFTLSGTSNGNGTLSRTVDGNYLAIAGYNQAPGPTGVVGVPDPKDTTSAQIGRMVARIATDGTVNTSTLLGTTVFNKSAPRGVASVNGSSFYVSGNGGTAPDSPVSGVDKVDLGGGNLARINQTAQKNVRQVQIADGGLYATSDKAPLLGFGKFNGASLPTTATAVTQLAAITTVSSTPKPVSDSYVPDALLVLDADLAVAGVDTAYVVVDTDAGNGIPGEIRKYTSNGTTWSLNGTKTGDYPFLTGRVNAGGTAVQLYATKSSAAGNTLVSFDDSTPTASATFGTETTLATAADGHSFRGVSFAPTGWNPGTIASDAPTASVANATVGGTLGDAHNPDTKLTLADTDTDPGDLTVTAHSSNAGVIPDSAITIDGSGLTRTVSFAPTGKGRSTITFTVTDDNSNIGTAVVSYAASTQPSSASGHYLYESSDLSSAVDVGDGYSLAVSSEDNTIRLYKQSESGRPVNTFDMGGDSPAGIGGTNADIEGMARVNDLLYVSGSHGNNSDGDLKPARRVLFTAALSGTGASTTIAYIGKYTGLWDDLRAWDQANGDRLGFAAGQADGVPANDPDGFNIEGLEFAPGSTSTAYLGFRSPVVTHAGKPHAVIVPVTNANNLILGTASTATFGDPIYLDLGGRTIRDIRKNSHNEYLISAQSDNGSPQWALFAWDGKPNDKPIQVKGLSDPDALTTGSWESVVSVPHPLSDGASVPLITDSGDSKFYDATPGSDESKGFRKSYADNFTTAGFTAFPTEPGNLAATTGPGSIGLNWDAVAGATSYNVTLKDGSTNVAGSPKSVPSGTTTTFTGLDSTKSYAATVTAVNGSGESDASDPVNATPDTVPTPPGTITNNGLPTISGTTKVGSTLTATDGSWTPSDTTFGYAWSADGTPIDGATSKTYVLTPAELGKTITVTVTASKTDFTTASATSSQTSAVANGAISNSGVPTIGGTERVGQTLTATGGAWTPSDITATYAWSADGAPIGGATDATYELTTAEVGKKITVTVTASKAGYTSASATSAQTAAVDPIAVTNSVPPSIGDAAVVGQKLTAAKGDWAPTTGVTFTYQWRADGNAIGNETSSTFTPTADQVGKKISVTVTGAKPGLTSLDKTSAETSAVSETPPPFGPPTHFTSVSRTSSTITLTWTKSTDATHYRIYSGIGTGTRTKLEVGNVSTATITGLKPSTQYSIDISAFKANGTQSSYSRPRLLASTGALEKPTNLVVTSRAATTITISWTKVPGVKNYRIYSGIGTGTRTKLEVGDVSEATIIGLKRGVTYSIDMASLSADKKLVSPYTSRISQATSSLLAPTKYTSTGHTPTTVSLKWTKSTGAESYRIYYGIGTGPRTRVDVGDVSTVVIPGLTKGKTYSIDIAAIEDSGTSRSSYSPRISVTTG